MKTNFSIVDHKLYYGLIEGVFSVDLDSNRAFLTGDAAYLGVCGVQEVCDPLGYKLVFDDQHFSSLDELAGYLQERVWI